MGSSPLGQYATKVAAIAAVLILAAYLVAVLVPTIGQAAVDHLEPLAILVLGWIIGGAVAVNGYKGPLVAFGAKLDAVQTKVAAIAAVPPDHPDQAHAIIAAAGDPTTTLGPLPAQDGAP